MFVNEESNTSNSRRKSYTVKFSINIILTREIILICNYNGTSPNASSPSESFDKHLILISIYICVPKPGYTQHHCIL